MAFHLQIRFAQGGFTGVDVFFVISGFLITSILLADLGAGRFSLQAFYVRRIRRILPALLAVLAASSAAALVLCLPVELEDFAKSLIAASLSASNFYFGLHSGYFEPLSLLRPALHTWSLGVEEQFYLLFPPALVLLRRLMPGRLPAALGLLAAASFALSVYGSLHTPGLAFFMPWTRACELLLGSLLATRAVPCPRSRGLRNAAAGLGLFLIAACDLLLTGNVPFPGFAALLPCGGAALLIWSGQAAESTRPTLVGRLLAARPMVFIGLISYSLYLWHWPLIVFQRISLWGELPGFTLPHRAVKAVLVLASFALAALSWRFIEGPFRDGSLRLRGPAAFRFAALSSGGLAAAGCLALALHGLPKRFPPEVVAVGSYVEEQANNRWGTCMVLRVRDLKPDPCLTRDPARPNWLLLGDSHAASQWEGLARAYPGVHFLQATLAACHPDPARTDGECGALSQAVFARFLPAHRVDRILMVGRWNPADPPTIDRVAAWTGAHGIPLTLIGPVQDYDAPLPRLLAYGLLRRDPGLANGRRLAATAEVDAGLSRLARDRWHIPYISLVALFCPGGLCQTYADPARGIPLLLDDDHFTNEGSDLAGERIAAAHLLPAGS